MIEASTTLGWLQDFSARAELCWTICRYGDGHWTVTVMQEAGPGIMVPLAGRGRAETIADAMRGALANLHFEPRGTK